MMNKERMIEALVVAVSVAAVIGLIIAAAWRV
jgi:hypothetical protein